MHTYIIFHNEVSDIQGGRDLRGGGRDSRWRTYIILMYKKTEK
jgi:hypothetical protein